MAQYGFFFDQGRCYSCQACSIACKDWNSLQPGPEKWMTVYEWESGNFPLSRIHTLAFSCGHCEDPACVKHAKAMRFSKRASTEQCSSTKRSASAAGLATMHVRMVLRNTPTIPRDAR